MSTDRINTPKASILMRSLRSMGYSFESAVADVIDNSISAHAKNVRVLFPKEPTDELALGILDDGKGMPKDVLFEAMRYGSNSAENERSEDDLGRFGMGLKSASLSQCRRLTVISYDGETLNGYVWDYKHILETQDWMIIELSEKEINELPYIENLKEQQQGTLVLWQDFDVISKFSGGQVFSTLKEYRLSLEKTLALIFHRFLSSPGSTRLHIFINELDLKPLDPFLEQHQKTTSKKEIFLDVKDSDDVERYICVRPFILPYISDLSDEDKQLIGGIENMRTRQGFYIYRNKRLIIWGTWFGVKRPEELTKNVRIRVDIPNTLDDIWSIDIKKQQATIPKQIRNRLKAAIEDALDFSTNQQTHRGRKKKINEEIDYIWDRIEDRDKNISYQINRNSILFKYVRDKMSDEDYYLMEQLLSEIEKNLPIQQLYIDKSKDVIAPADKTDKRMDDVYQKGITIVSFLLQLRDDNAETIIEELMKSEPLCNYPDVKNKLVKYFIPS